MAETLVFLAFAGVLVILDWYASNAPQRDAQRRNQAHCVRKEMDRCR